MDLLSIFKRKKTASAARAAPADSVQLARTRARRRLTGAAVLVVIGIIGFPLLFETQQRPIPVDVQIDIPRKDKAAPLVMPAPRRAASVAAVAQPLATDNTATEPKVHAGGEMAPTAKPAAAATEPKSNAAAGTSAAKEDAARARALLEGRPVGAVAEPAAARGARFVVQVGAFFDTAAAREARLKLEALGLKTYVQVADTAAGKLIRVRAGPYATRQQADEAAAMVKDKDAALSVVVLSL